MCSAAARGAALAEARRWVLRAPGVAGPVAAGIEAPVAAAAVAAAAVTFVRGAPAVVAAAGASGARARHGTLAVDAAPGVGSSGAWRTCAAPRRTAAVVACGLEAGSAGVARGDRRIGAGAGEVDCEGDAEGGDCEAAWASGSAECRRRGSACMHIRSPEAAGSAGEAS